MSIGRELVIVGLLKLMGLLQDFSGVRSRAPKTTEVAEAPIPVQLQNLCGKSSA